MTCKTMTTHHVELITTTLVPAFTPSKPWAPTANEVHGAKCAVPFQRSSIVGGDDEGNDDVGGCRPFASYVAVKESIQRTPQ